MPELTSESSPLRIAELRLPNVPGRLGLTICPGKKGQSAASHIWNRDLAVDLEAVREWPADAVITLLEEFEFDLLGVQLLGREIEALGMKWFHFEITDGEPPDSRFESVWPKTIPKIYDLLQSGASVVIHCRGGLGRTGTVAALIMQEFGASPADAIDKVRSIRPGAIETSDQENYVKNYQAISTRRRE